MDRPTPLDSDIPGGFPETPASQGQRSQMSYIGRPDASRLEGHAGSNQEPAIVPSITTPSSDDTAVASGRPSGVLSLDQRPIEATEAHHPTEEVERLETSSIDSDRKQDAATAIKGSSDEKRPSMSRQITEDDVMSHLRRRPSTASRHGTLSRTATQATQEDKDEQAEINRLMSRMFGKTRQANSEEERTRHRGVVFKNLTVKGMGLGAALQPTFGDVFMNIPRLIKNVSVEGYRPSLRLVTS